MDACPCPGSLFELSVTHPSGVEGVLTTSHHLSVAPCPSCAKTVATPQFVCGALSQGATFWCFWKLYPLKRPSENRNGSDYLLVASGQLLLLHGDFLW